MTRPFAILIILLILKGFSAGQTRVGADVIGTVTDDSGAAIGNADVRLTTPQQLVVDATRTDSQGRYSFHDVANGFFLVVASRKDFSTKSVSVNVGGGRPVTLDLVLSVSQLSEQVSVTADTGRAEELVKIPQQINVVTADAIRQRTTGVLAQIADEETGVSLQRTSPTVGAVLVRGLTEVGVYVDGIRYTNSTQRGGINTFFNLNEASGLQSVEIQRSPNTAQFGSDGLGGNVQLLSRQPSYGFDEPRWNGEFNPIFTSADRSFGGNALLSYGTRDLASWATFILVESTRCGPAAASTVIRRSRDFLAYRQT